MAAFVGALALAPTAVAAVGVARPDLPSLVWTRCSTLSDCARLRPAAAARLRSVLGEGARAAFVDVRPFALARDRMDIALGHRTLRLAIALDYPCAGARSSGSPAHTSRRTRSARRL